jgi:exodeoxyribonuclease VII large subunit
MMHTRLAKIDLRRLVGMSGQVLAGHQRQLLASVELRLQKERSRLELATGRLHALSPLEILARGYAICRNAEGRIMKDAALATAGDRVSVKLARGELNCQVNEIKGDSDGSQGEGL